MSQKLNSNVQNIQIIPEKMFVFWPKSSNIHKPWRDTISILLTENIDPDASRLCIEYLLPPAGKSCTETCGTVEMYVLQYARARFHSRSCPIAPEICYICSKKIFTDNEQCANSHLHEFVREIRVIPSRLIKNDYESLVDRSARYTYDDRKFFVIVKNKLRPLIRLGAVAIAFLLARYTKIDTGSIYALHSLAQIYLI